ncbi:MAG: DUF1508 domain-containing protein [Actinomycetota bacterium]|nr:DUF1508 domain-containing protein [Actinomycetota bacterium]
MAGKFVLSKDRAGSYRFSLLASNGKVVAVSESYSTKRSALGGIASVRRHAAAARLVDESGPDPSTLRP